MDKQDISAIIGERLHRLRRDRGLSLDAVADMTGVSKPMLGQIERGVSNPTVATLWKIASGLKVPFTAFIAEEPHVTVLRRDEQPAFYDDSERYQVFNTHTSPDGHVEVFRFQLLPGCHRHSEAHASGVVESITLADGQVEIALHQNEGGKTSHILNPGDALTFPGDTPHEYINRSDSGAYGQLVIIYP